jgi:hypothetical protein
MIVQRIRLSRTAAACCCVNVASLAWIISCAPGLAGAVAAEDASGSAADLALLLLGLGAMASLRTLFRRTGFNHANRLRQTMRLHRAVVLLMLVSRMVQLHGLGLPGAAELVMLLGATAALYLGACTEPPPVRRAWPSLVPTG